MPITFRCTRCRARLHVPSRWGGTSVACPKCTTRVMVPAGGGGQQTPFERRDVERSLEALQARPGGIFADTSFELPEADGSAETVATVVETAAGDGLTLPRWSIYAGIAMFATTAVVSFMLGAWWAASETGTVQP